jgi:hypothetical protein
MKCNEASKFMPEKIIGLLWQVEVDLTQGKRADAHVLTFGYLFLIACDKDVITH